MTENTLEAVKKINLIDKKVFNNKDRNFYNKYPFVYENLTNEILFAHFPNYPWNTHFDIVSKKLYIFNSCVMPEDSDTIFIPKVKNCDIYYDKVLDLAAKILYRRQLPYEGNDEKIKELVSEVETKLKELIK